MTADRAIWQSAQNLLVSGGNLDKLWESLDVILCKERDLIIEYESEDSYNLGWLDPVCNAYYKVQQRPKGRIAHTGWITLSIQLTCVDENKGDWQNGKRAKVLAGYSPYSSFDDAWGFDSNSPNSSGMFEDCKAQDLFWIHEDNKSWFFAVPLDELTSTNAVETLIVEPMRRIIRGETADKVLGPIRDRMCLPPSTPD